jgi:hypothetical protein
MIPAAVSGAMVIALIGWFATLFVIGRSKLNSRRKRILLIASWIPWLMLALGAPIISGIVSLSEAANIGGAMTMGMLVSVLVSRRLAPRE